MDENQDKIVFNELKPFDKQVDDVLSGADTTSSHLEVLKKTPPLLRMVGVPNLPILMTAYHVKTITQENGSGSANYHGLNVDVVKKLPELLSDPVMIMDSLTRDDSIVVVTQTVDKENRPVIGAIKLGGKGYLNSIEVDANILSSAYGRESFQSFIERNIAQGKILYVDKEKSQELAKIPGIQFPDNFATLDFDIIIRKTNAFVNREEEKKPESTEKNEGSMKADTNNATAQSARERVQQIRDEMVKTLLAHIEKNPTDWQSGWNNIAAGAPYNGKTNTAYRGINALYLAFLGAARGYKDTRWVTFNQAKELGASVKKGEKSSPVIFFEFYDRATKKAFDSRTVKDMTEEEKAAYLKENVYAVMKYSSVFNAEQCHNFPERKDVAMSEEERAKQNIKIEAIIANSSAPVRYDGGSRAYYSPGTDSIHLPVIQAFDTMQDYYATALHEIAHSTGHESRLKRDLSGGFGSESYAKEELRAELACVFMQMEQGIQLNGKHITNHAAYLNSWLEAAKKDTSVFFKAAADAQKIADYVADNYLQAAAVAGTADENVAQDQTEEQPERDPMADYLRAESEKRAEEIRTVERLRAEESSIQLNYYDYTRRGAFVEGITAAPRESFYGGHIAIINNNEQLESDKPAGYILASGGYSPNSGDFIDAAYGFDTYEQAREYCVEHYGIDVGESTAAQGLNQNIKEWYSRAYPSDSAGEDIRSEATFNDLQEKVRRSDANAVYGKAIKRIDRAVVEVATKQTMKLSEMRSQETHIQTMNGLQARIQNENELLFDCTLTVTGLNNGDLDNSTFRKEVRRELTMNGYRTSYLLGRQFEGFAKSTVARRPKLKAFERGINSDSLAAVFPFVFSSIIDVDGYTLGWDYYPVILDIWKRDREHINSNGIIFGKSGSGKSFFSKLLIEMIYSGNSRIFILDPENEYQTLAKNVDGLFIDIGNATQGRINPLQIYPVLTDEGEIAEPDVVFNAHLQFLEDFFKITLKGITQDSFEELNNLVKIMYESVGINHNTDCTEFPPERYPTFDTLKETVEKEMQKPDLSPMRKTNLERVNTYIQKFAAGGMYSSLWNGASTLEVNSKFVVFNFQSLFGAKNKTVANAQILVVMRYLDMQIINIREMNRNSDGEVIHPFILLDEGYNFIDPDYPVALQFVYLWYKRIRKYEGSIFFATQNLSDIFGNEAVIAKTTAIVNNSQYSFVFGLAPADLEILTDLYKNVGGLNDTERAYISDAGNGDCFAICSARQRTRFHVVAHDTVRALFEQDGAGELLSEIQ